MQCCVLRTQGGVRDDCDGTCPSCMTVQGTTVMQVVHVMTQSEGH